jgi:thymidylate synthase (FAD)
MEVKLTSITQPLIEGLVSPEDLISYTARVSNPSNQLNTETAPKLLKYLIQHKHWSPFEHVSLTFQIVTSRAIAAQILRHRSFCFQEFSQRYSTNTELESFDVRQQALKNRQSSSEQLELSEDNITLLKDYLTTGVKLYEDLIEKGAAKECARMFLPLCTQTTLFMTGTLRSWIHYVEVRTDKTTQLEHREIALAIKEGLISIFPNVTEALEWTVDKN